MSIADQIKVQSISLNDAFEMVWALNQSSVHFNSLGLFPLVCSYRCHIHASIVVISLHLIIFCQTDAFSFSRPFTLLSVIRLLWNWVWCVSHETNNAIQSNTFQGKIDGKFTWFLLNTHIRADTRCLSPLAVRYIKFLWFRHSDLICLLFSLHTHTYEVVMRSMRIISNKTHFPIYLERQTRAMRTHWCIDGRKFIQRRSNSEQENICRMSSCMPNHLEAFPVYCLIAAPTITQQHLTQQNLIPSDVLTHVLSQIYRRR